MSLTVNNFNQYSSIATSNDLVSASELASITKELFAAAPTTKSTATTSSALNTSFTKVASTNNSLTLFGENAKLSDEQLQQVIANKAGYNVTLSDNALKSINSLNAQAAKVQTNAYAKQMDGKVYVPAEATESEKTTSITEAPNAPTTYEISSIDKDRKGSNPFCATAKNEQKQNNSENINIFAQAVA